MDHDGDTDMTPSSPAESRDSRVTNPYYNRPTPEFEDHSNQTPRGERDVSISSAENSLAGGPYDGMYESDEHRHARLQQQHYDNQRNNHQQAQQLGYSNAMQHVEADSSDSSIRPAGRRARRPQTVASVQQQYNPRISMMFREHQAAAARSSGSQENPISFEDWSEDDEVRQIEPATSSRNPNRRMTAYRNMPPRRVDPLRSSRYPSSTRVISSSQRNNRLPRQYDRRG